MLDLAIQWNRVFALDASGTLRWAIKPAKQIAIGDEAGALKDNGYRVVMYNYKLYRVHHIIFEMTTGIRIPIGYEVDHIDGNPLNNQPNNLRLATTNENKYNTKRRVTNTVGVKGICIIKRKHFTKYLARVMRQGKAICKTFPFTNTGLVQAANWLKGIRLALHGEFANNG